MQSDKEQLPELKPCPFCGHIGLDFREGSTFRWLAFSCGHCGIGSETRVQTMGYGTPEEWRAKAEGDAVKFWNTRDAAELRRLHAECEKRSQESVQNFERAREWAQRYGALEAECEALRKSLALVQQHHATSWNRGHQMGMMANRHIAKQAQEAVANDAWGNTQLTEALMSAEAKCDALQKRVEELEALREESAWLIEFHAPPELGGGISYVNAAEENWSTGSIERALRFARKEDAEAFFNVYEAKTIFRHDERWRSLYRIAEHKWC